MVDNVIKDVSRSIARLDKHASTGPGDIVNIDGTNWTGLDLRISVAENLGDVIKNAVTMRKLTRRDVALMMAAHGASTFTLERHARAIAAMLRADISRHTWGGGF